MQTLLTLFLVYQTEYLNICVGDCLILLYSFK